jgi:hypothetical protein
VALRGRLELIDLPNAYLAYIAKLFFRVTFIIPAIVANSFPVTGFKIFADGMDSSHQWGVNRMINNKVRSWHPFPILSAIGLFSLLLLAPNAYSRTCDGRRSCCWSTGTLAQRILPQQIARILLVHSFVSGCSWLASFLSCISQANSAYRVL